MIFSCIIVTYNPDLDILHNCIESLISQVDVVIIVNNDKRFCGKDFLRDVSHKKKCNVIDLGANYGIAYAQNRGIEFAISHDIDYVVFSDQDTVYPNDFVQKSFACFSRHHGEKIGAVVPLFYNENKKQYAQVNIKKSKAIVPKLGKEYTVTQAISSGTVCPVSVLSGIGMMNERLFIDFVDYEWCWRIIKEDYKIICDTGNVINHNMGDSYKIVFGRKIVVYSNFRNYFFFRNGVWLLFHSKLFTFAEWIGFAEFMFIKSILFFITKGLSFENLRLFFSACHKGFRNKLSFEEDINK